MLNWKLKQFDVPVAIPKPQWSANQIVDFLLKLPRNWLLEILCEAVANLPKEDVEKMQQFINEP